MREARQPGVVLSDDRHAAGLSSEPRRPCRPAVGDNVAVQERVGVGAAEVPTPAVGVQQRYLPGVVGTCCTEP
jgi:hypothetical protein